MHLEDIGFYTLSEQRAKTASATSPLSRCEMVLTGKCNFHCPYCQGNNIPEIRYDEALSILRLWIDQELINVRFSGGEPTCYRMLSDLCYFAYNNGVKRIAVSTNGSASKACYQKLINSGVSDFSISLDASNADKFKQMSGGIDAFDRVISNIEWLSKQTYVTIGTVLTDDNMENLEDIINLVSSLGVSDIRIIPASQNKNNIRFMDLPENITAKHPILKYRIDEVKNKIAIRGLQNTDSHKCGLVLDDIAVSGYKHFPCIIYFREHGDAIGIVSKNMRKEREEWFKVHDTHSDPICFKNCLDVCREYNNKWEKHH